MFICKKILDKFLIFFKSSYSKNKVLILLLTVLIYIMYLPYDSRLFLIEPYQSKRNLILFLTQFVLAFHFIDNVFNSTCQTFRALVSSLSSSSVTFTIIGYVMSEIVYLNIYLLPAWISYFQICLFYKYSDSFYTFFLIYNMTLCMCITFITSVILARTDATSYKLDNKSIEGQYILLIYLEFLILIFFQNFNSECWLYNILFYYCIGTIVLCLGIILFIYPIDIAIRIYNKPKNHKNFLIKAHSCVYFEIVKIYFFVFNFFIASIYGGVIAIAFLSGGHSSKTDNFISPLIPAIVSHGWISWVRESYVYRIGTLEIICFVIIIFLPVCSYFIYNILKEIIRFKNASDGETINNA